MQILNIWTSFVALFTEMSWIVILLLCLGFVLCFIEAIVPGFGIFGILGMACEGAGIILHAVTTGSAVQAIILFFLVLIVMGIVFLIFLHSARSGLLAKSAIVENASSLPENYGQKQKEALGTLVGKEGITVCDCKPLGKMQIDNAIFEVETTGEFIAKGTPVKIVQIVDAKVIIIKKEKD